MPQVQVLPYVPSTGERFTAALSQHGPVITQGIKGYYSQKNSKAAMDILNDPNATPIQRVNALMTLPEEQRKHVGPIWAAILGPQAEAQASQNLFSQLQGQLTGRTPSIRPESTPQDMNGLVGSPSSNIPNSQQQLQMADQGGSLAKSEQPVDPNDLTTWPDWALAQVSSLKGPVSSAASHVLQQRATEKKEKSAKEDKIFAKNEPILTDISEKLQTLEIEDARFARLEELFKNKDKFPSAFLASLFSKDGQINPIASTLLSPEAQESIKLVQDELSGAKDTFGARVTNFDVQNYLKRLPSLLNTPEGRDRVLRDLRMINDVNRNYYEGVLDLIEKKGGSDKISFSSAERLWKKENKEKLSDWKERFANPSGSSFKSLPEASKFSGRKVRNEETGEVFISNGKEWKPVSQ